MKTSKYSAEITEFIEAIQRAKFVTLGPDYEREVKSLFPDENFMFQQIEKELEEEFGDDYDNKFELEALLKNEATKEIPNLTRFESPQHKILLNTTELLYRSIVEDEFQKNIPFHGVLYSKEPDAEILEHPSTGLPVIFFNGGLFDANLMFSKLYVQLIKDDPTDSHNSLIPYSIKNDSATLKKIDLLATYFHNYHFSGISKSERSYSLKSNFEKSLLAVLLESMTLFIYAHEVGHAYYGHYKRIEASTEELWKDEFRADYFAMETIGALYNNREESMVLTFLGPIIFLKFRFFLEKYKPEIGDKETHPPTMERLKFYYQWLENVIRPEDKEIMYSILKLEHEISSILTNIFNNIDKGSSQK